MLDDIGEVHVIALDVRCLQCPVKNSACRHYEWSSLQSFLIARLLTDEHYLGPDLSLSEDRPASLPQIATAALHGLA